MNTVTIHKAPYKRFVHLEARFIKAQYWQHVLQKTNTDTVPPTPPKSATDCKYGWILKTNMIVNFLVKLGVQMNHSLETLDLIQKTNTTDPTMMLQV